MKSFLSIKYVHLIGFKRSVKLKKTFYIDDNKFHFFLFIMNAVEKNIFYPKRICAKVSSFDIMPLYSTQNQCF